MPCYPLTLHTVLHASPYFLSVKKMRDKILISLLPFPLVIPWVCSALHLGLSALWVALQVRKERHKLFHSHLADIWSSRTLNILRSPVAGYGNLHIQLKSESVSLHSYLKTDMADSQQRGVLGTSQSSFIISFFLLKHLQLFLFFFFVFFQRSSHLTSMHA